LAEIQINRVTSPTTQVQLRDGRILVPEARFDELKKFNERFGGGG